MKTTTQENEMLEVALPFFSGFYESELSAMMDREIESEAEYNGKEVEWLWDRYDFQAAMIAIARGWTKAFADETGIPVEFENVSSPKQYNFTTDRIFAYIPLAEVKKLEPLRHSEEFKTILKQWFTSYDGFCSFYENSPDHEDWQKPIEQWDHNELSALLAAKILRDHGDKDDFVMSLYEHYAVQDAVYEGWKPESLPSGLDLQLA